MQIDCGEQYRDIVARNAALAAWMKACGAEQSSAEVYRFLRWPEAFAKYLFYVNVKTMRVTTWTGDVLGVIEYLGPRYRCGRNRSERQAIRVQGINGRIYHGTYFVSSGDYAKCEAAKVAS